MMWRLRGTSDSFFGGGILKWDVFFEIIKTGMVENRGMEWICFW